MLFGRGPRRRAERLERRAARRVRRDPLQASALLALARAHRLLNEGQPAEAAPLFANLAEGAVAHGLPERAAQLNLQAARCHSLLGARLALVDHALRAVALAAGAGDMSLLTFGLPRFIQEQRGRGFAAEAEQIQQALNAALGPAAAPASAPAPLTRVRLPTACPQCGGPVRSDEVEWIDEVSAACSYCGAVLAAA